MNPAAPAEATISNAFLTALHPTGSPSRIRRERSKFDDNPSPKADVIVFAPTAPERGRLSFRKAVTYVVGNMAPGAVVYAAVPPFARLRLKRLLHAAGLNVDTPMILLRGGAASYHVPLDPMSLRFALESLPLSPRWRSVARLLSLFPRSADWLWLVLPRVGIAACHTPYVPFAWLLSSVPGGKGRAVVATSWRGPDAPALVFVLKPGSATPALVAKIAAGAHRAKVAHERAMLEQLGASAELAGFNVPRCLGFSDSGTVASLLQTPVPGRPLRYILAGRPGELAPTIDAAATMLGRWHRATFELVRLSDAICEELILEPARSLAEILDRGREYVAWLETRTTALAERNIPLVHAHNDFTAANVLRGATGSLGIVDLEEARPQGLPLADFWYFACDAAMVALDEERPSAFDRCFALEGETRALVRLAEQRLRASVGGEPDWIELCFHGCWLNHAANEQARSASDADRPFLAIVNTIVRRTLVNAQGRGSTALH